MNGMPFDMVLTQPLAETFGCGGLAPNIPAAHNLAWDALEASLGGDPGAAWTLKTMEHEFVPSAERPGVQFRATFARNPEYDGEGS